jgi:hypothetical protein
MYTSASHTIDPRVPMHAPAWFDLDDEVLPRRVVRAVAQPDDKASSLVNPDTCWALTSSGAPPIQIPILRRNLRRRTLGMAARIEPSLFIDAHHQLEN